MDLMNIDIGLDDINSLLRNSKEENSIEPCFKIFSDTCTNTHPEDNETLEHLIISKFFSDTDPDNSCGGKWRPLQVAAAHGKTLLIQMLLDNGSDVNAKSRNDNRTALHRAVYYNQFDSVRLLLERGADVTIRDSKKMTAFNILVLRFDSKIDDNLSNAWNKKSISKPYTISQKIENLQENLEMQKILLTYGRQIEGNLRNQIRFKEYYTLCGAILENDIPTVQDVIKKIEDVDFEEISEVQPLLYASLLDRWDIVKIFLEKKADVKKVLDIGLDFKKEMIIEKCLLYSKKDPSINDWCEKALKKSCLQGYLEMLKLLIRYGSTLPMKDRIELLPKLYSYNKIVVLEYLLSRGLMRFDFWKKSLGSHYSTRNKCRLFTIFCEYSRIPQEKWNVQTHVCMESQETCSFIEYANKLKLINYPYAKTLLKMRSKIHQPREQCICYSSDESDEFGFGYWFRGGHGSNDEEEDYCGRCGNYKGYHGVKYAETSDESPEEFPCSEDENDYLNNNEKLLKYRLELDELHKVKISAKMLSSPSQSILDFLFFNSLKAARFSQNENLAKLYKECGEDFGKAYPHYGSILNRKYNRAIRRENLLTSAAELIEFALGTGIPKSISEEILQYFSDSKLKKLKIVQKVKKSKSSKSSSK